MVVLDIERVHISQINPIEFAWGTAKGRVRRLNSKFNVKNLEKLLWRELLVYTLSFLAISALYRVGLSTEQQLLMEKLIR